MTGSTDMGDLICLIPCIHPLLGGFSGAAHSREFRIADPEIASHPKNAGNDGGGFIGRPCGRGTRTKGFYGTYEQEEYLQYLTKQKNNI